MTLNFLMKVLNHLPLYTDAVVKFCVLTDNNILLIILSAFSLQLRSNGITFANHFLFPSLNSIRPDGVSWAVCEGKEEVEDLGVLVQSFLLCGLGQLPPPIWIHNLVHGQKRNLW